MGNLSTSKVGFGKVTVKMTSEKLRILNNVFHVANIRKKKLVADLLLNKDGFKMVFESDKVLLSKMIYL